MTFARVWHILIVVWVFGCGITLLKYPVQALKVLLWTGSPTGRQLRGARIVGWLALFFGGVYLLEILLGIVGP